MAEDVLQEVLFLIYRKIKWLREPELFRAWCYRIASREAIKALKGQIDSEPLEEDAISIEPAEEQMAIEREELRVLENHIDQLSPASRIVILLRYREEMELSEIATILGISVGTVKSRSNYGLNKLRKIFAKAREDNHAKE